MHAIINKKNEVLNLKDNKEGYMGGLQGRKAKQK